MTPQTEDEKVQAEICALPDLCLEGQVTLERRVREGADAHPEWAVLQRRIEAMEELLIVVRAQSRRGRPEAASVPGSAASRGEVASSKEESLSGTVRAEDDQRKRDEAYQCRLCTLESESQDPADHFEELVGQRPTPR